EHVEVPGTVQNAERFARDHAGRGDHEIVRIERGGDRADGFLSRDHSISPGRTTRAPGTDRSSIAASNRSSDGRGSPGSRIWYGRSSNSSIPSVLTPMTQCSGASRGGPP